MSEEKVHLLQPERNTENITQDVKTVHQTPSSSRINYGTSNSSRNPALSGDKQSMLQSGQLAVSTPTQQPAVRSSRAVGLNHPLDHPVIQQPAGLQQAQLTSGYQAAVINVHPRDQYKVSLIDIRKIVDLQ